MDSLLDWEEARFRQWAAAPRMAVRTVSAGLPSPGHPLAAIVPMKVPLSTVYEGRYGGEVSGFTVSHVVQRMQTAQLRILAVLDATGQAGFFHTVKEWAEWDIHYVKLGSGGRGGVEGGGGGSSSGGGGRSSGGGGGGSSGGGSGEVALGNDAPPTAAMQASFTALVTECLTKDPKGVVLVIDEYGYNRSGALIVRHLVEACGVAPGDALAALGKCRAPGLYSPAALAWALGSLDPHAVTGFTPAAAPAWDKRTEAQRSAWSVISQPLPPAFVTQALTTLEDDCGAVSLSIPGGAVVSTAVEGDGEGDDVFGDAEPPDPTPAAPPVVPVMGPPQSRNVRAAGLPPRHSGGSSGGAGGSSSGGGGVGRPAHSGGSDPREGAGSVKRARTGNEEGQASAPLDSPASSHAAATAADSGPPPPLEGAALLSDAASPFGVGTVVAPGSTLFAWVAARIHRLCKQPLDRLCDPGRWVLSLVDAGTLARPDFASKHMLTWRPVGIDCLVLLCPLGLVFVLPQPGVTMAVVTAALPHTLMDTLIDGTIVTERGPAGSTITRLLVGDVLVVGGKLMTGRDLSARLGHMIELVMKPLRQVTDNGSLVLPLRVREKAYVLPKAIGGLLSSTIPTLPHKCGGVLLVHSKGTHLLHSEAMPVDVAPALLPTGGPGGSSSVSQEDLQAACTPSS